MSSVALENLRNELRLDPVSALATQCTRTATATVTARTLLRKVAFWQRTVAVFFGFVFLLNLTNIEFSKGIPRLNTKLL